MSSGETPFMSRTADTALDLTVKRLDMDEQTPNMQHYNYERYNTYGHTMDGHRVDGHTVNVPMGQEYAYTQYPHTSPQDGEYQYVNGYCPDGAYTSNIRQPCDSSPLSVTNPSFTIQPGTYSSTSSCVQDQDSLDSYQSSGTSSVGAPYESSIIPKKRKILWRPYDSKLLLGQGGSDVDKESDSGSDSTSGSYSDQEFKTPSPPADPVKKRKTHRSYNSNKESDSDERPMKSGNPDPRENIPRCTPAGDNDVIDGPMCGNWYSAPSRGETACQVPSKPANSAVKSNSSSRSSTESRDKLISGMKKRDIFGWSLKLKNPSVSEDAPISCGNDSSQTGEHRVCTDGNKTYIELQTVKKTSPEPPHEHKVNNESKTARSQPQQSVLSQQNTDNQTSHTKASLKDTAVIDTKLAESEKENKESNYVSKKVYIQRRDNVIECCNEAESKKTVKPETKKGLSLIDLVEEIEASALTIDKDEVEKTNQKNRNIVKLLEQCNYVKLQALDYLMANVLIKDKQPQFKCKNENVQRMLKGDKINSVNMLDVVELQVEIGLN